MGEINYKKLAELHEKMYDGSATLDERLNYALMLYTAKGIDSRQFNRYKEDPYDLHYITVVKCIGGLILLEKHLENLKLK